MTDFGLSATTAKKTYTKFHLRLFWSVTSVLLLISVCFTGFHYIREKQFKVELWRVKMTAEADAIHEKLMRGLPTDSLKAQSMYRISIIDFSGKVLYDSEVSDLQHVENHALRKEVRRALEKGSGYDVHRRSVLTGDDYFFSAKKYDTCIIRICAPYNSEIVSELQVSSFYFAITAAVLFIFVVLFYNVMHHLGANINRLNDFVSKVESEDVDDYPNEDYSNFFETFSNDEVGNISRHVVQIYYRLQKTKKALISEQQLVHKQQEEQDRMKRQLTYNIAHELKTPVSSIQGYLETIINNKNIEPAILDKFIEKSYQQSTRLSSLLHDISTLTRIDEAPGLVTKEQVDLSQLIVDILDDAAIALKEKNIRVHNKTAGLSLVCKGSESLLYSVFRNMVDNTIAYAGEGIEVFIECNTEDPAFYIFSYSDNGVGIPNEHIERIFERFYRIDKGRSRKAGGTGLGLSIVKNAILLHGGSVTAKQHPGGGLEFVFSIGR